MAARMIMTSHSTNCYPACVRFVKVFSAKLGAVASFGGDTSKQFVKVFSLESFRHQSATANYIAADFRHKESVNETL